MTMSEPIAVFTWWLIIQILGLAVWPLLTRWLRWLPDRGYMLAKPIGLLLVSYGLWILATIGLIQNTTGGIVAVLIGVAALSVWAWRGFPTSSAKDDRTDLRGLWREHRALFIAYEIVFAVALIGWAIFRAHSPDLSTTEKPMEFAFLNAINRSATFPPQDPWLSGYAIAYYYFGYVMMSLMHKLTGVTAGITFSLSNAFWFALAAASAFGVVGNLVLLFKRQARTAAIIFATLGAVMLALMGNFQGSLEVAHASNVGSPEFWHWLDILEINGPTVQNSPEVPWWTPRQGWWWWRSSRVIHDYPPDQVSPLLSQITGLPASDPSTYQEAIDEFPQFSYVLGDMHPHVLALPFALVLMALALNLYQGAARGEITSLWSGEKRAPLWPLYALAVGSLSFLNTWDFPIYAFVLMTALGLGYWRAGKPRLWEVVIDLLVLGAIGVAFYVPFYRGFTSQAGGIAPNLYNGTRFAQFFVMFGPFLIIGLMFGLVLIYQAVRGKQTRGLSFIGKAVGGGLGIVALLALAAGVLGFGVTLVSEKARTALESTIAAMAQNGLGVSDHLMGRLLSPWTPLLLGIALASIVLLWIARRKPIAIEQEHNVASPLDFVLLLFGVGLLLTIGTEFMFLVDGFGYRMNTIFKFYYQAWALWAVASAFAAYYLIANDKLHRIVRGAAAIIVVVIVVLGLVFPAMAIPTMTAGQAEPTLDALAYTARYAPDDYAAAQWLNANAQGNPVILETPGDEYNAGMSRISTWTGLPSVVGWHGHEGQWRGNYDIQGPRQAQIEEIYTTTDANRMLELLKQLDVRFVIVGPNEQHLYPPDGLVKFGQYLPVAFQQGEVTIYQVP
jgi:YYY domain-containing protein